MNARIDLSRDLIEVVNPVTGKIEKCSITKTLKETTPLDVLTDLIDEKAKTQNLIKKIAFLESKVTTLSVTEWEEYKAL